MPADDTNALRLAYEQEAAWVRAHALDVAVSETRLREAVTRRDAFLTALLLVREGA